MNIKTVNPSTGKLIKNYAELLDDELDIIIQKSAKSFEKWSKLKFLERKRLILKVAEIMRANIEEYAALITFEMGKVISESRAEIKKCVWICEHFAEYSEKYLESRIVDTELSKSLVCYQPQGIVFAIMPWNFPFWQVFRFAAPNLMAGNVGILSHAPIVTGCGQKIVDIFTEAGFPEGVFSSPVISTSQASRVISHPSVCGVSLTGSERAGKAVASEAAKHLKKVVLELGGSDPYIILDDADIETAVTTCVTSRMLCCGQVCISPKRIIVVESIYEVFEEKVVELVKSYQPNNPMDESSNLGPMARDDLRESLHKQVEESIRLGAKCLTGGKKMAGEGFYYQPTVLSNVSPDMPAFSEELFGPVVVLIRARDESEAIALANNTDFGLGAAVFTKDVERGEHIAREKLAAGICAVNTRVASDPRLPFGGIKSSGYGRECAAEGIKEFMNTKTVMIK